MVVGFDEDPLASGSKKSFCFCESFEVSADAPGLGPCENIRVRRWVIVGFFGVG